jgi:hypothetical protein
MEVAPVQRRCSYFFHGTSVMALARMRSCPPRFGAVLDAPSILALLEPGALLQTRTVWRRQAQTRKR